MELVLHLVDRGEAAPELVADLLQAPGHLGGVHGGVHRQVRGPDQPSFLGIITYFYIKIYSLSSTSHYFSINVNPS